MPGLRENIERTLSREPEIDKEFSSLIPPLTPDEYSGLEQSILSEGCRDAIILWNNIIIDGHNRYKICKEHNIPFRTETKDFATRQDVILWMFHNQLSRRNLNDFQRVEVVRRYETTVKAQAAKRQEATRFGSGSNKFNTTIEKTRDTLGKMTQISGKTYEHATAILDNAPEAVIQAVRKNELSINAGYTVTKLTPEEQEEISERIKNGEKANQVVTEVRNRKKRKNNFYIDLIISLSSNDYEQVKSLAKATNTDIHSMIVQFIQEALKARTA